MPISFTDEFKIDKEAFLKTGAFDVILDIDSKFFIDPALLSQCKVPEFVNSKQKVETHFTDIIKLLSFSQQYNDIFWKEAEKRFKFKEVSGTCFGYSKNGTMGRGIGRGFRKKILRAIKDLINAGHTDPAIFELVGAFQEGVGCDRISDLITNILMPEIIEFTNRIINDFDIKTKKIKILNDFFDLPYNKYNSAPIFLIPNNLLTPLPLAVNFEDIENVCLENYRVRKTLNEDYIFNQKNNKKILRELLLINKDFCKEWVNAYKIAKPCPYNWKKDPIGQYIWYEYSKYIVNNNELPLKIHNNPTARDVYSITKAICKQFKKSIEDLGCWKIIYDDNNKPRHEDVVQLFFYGVACSYFEANNIDFSKECNNGRGPVDFKLSRGATEKIIVEVKLTSNKQLKHGILKQLPIYMTQENTKKAIYLVIDNGHEKTLKNFKEFIEKQDSSVKDKIECIYIDGGKQLSASVA